MYSLSHMRNDIVTRALGEDATDALNAYFKSLRGVVAVILFGSLARGEARSGSDVDLGVLFSHERSKETINLSKLTTDVMNVLNRKDVDVVNLNRAPPLLMHRVVRDGHVLYCADNRTLGEFTIRALQRYEDTRPLRRLQAERLDRQLAASTDRRTQDVRR